MLQVRTKYDGLVTSAVISAEELELAQRSARRKNLDIETVLMEEFQVKVPALGESLAAYFGVPYEPFKPDRIKPPDLMKNMSREFCQTNQWVPLEDTKDGIVIVTIDPEKIKASRMVNNVYPKSKIIYKVTTNREFAATARADVRRRSWRRAAGHRPHRRHSGHARRGDRHARGRRRGRRLGRKRQRGGEARQQGHHRRLPAGRLGHPRRTLPRQGQDRDPLPQGRRADELHLGAGKLPQRDRRAAEDHVRPRHLRAPAARRTARSSSRSSARSTSSCGSPPYRPRAVSRTS